MDGRPAGPAHQGRGGSVRRSGRRQALVLLVVAALALTLTACGAMFRNSEEVDRIREHFDGNPAVEEVRASGSAKWPFEKGTVSTLFEIHPDADDAAIRELAREIGEYQNNSSFGPDSSTYRILMDGVETTVVADQAGMDRRFTQFFALRDDGDVREARVLAPAGDELAAIAITAVDPDTVQDIARRWQNSPWELHEDRGDGEYELEITADGRNYGVVGPPGPWWESSFEAWNAAAAQYEVNSVTVTPESLQISVTDDAGAGEVEDMAQRIVGPDVVVTVSGGMLNVAEGADGSTARAVLDGLPDDVRVLVTEADMTDAALNLTVVGESSIRPVAEAVLEVPESANAPGIHIGSESASVTAAPEALLAWVGHVEEIRDNTNAVGIGLDSVDGGLPGQQPNYFVSFDTSEPATDGEIVFIAETLRPLVAGPTKLILRFGEERNGRSDTLNTVVDPNFDMENSWINSRMQESPRWDLFVRTWNEGG